MGDRLCGLFRYHDVWAMGRQAKVSLKPRRLNLQLTAFRRAAFNQAFLPAIFYHTPQTEVLKPGDFRKHVAMNVDVEIREATVWRMPTRESSKVGSVSRSWLQTLMPFTAGLDVRKRYRQTEC